MKFVAVLIVMIVFLMAGVGTGFAQQDHNASMDGFIGLGTEPGNDFGTGFGLGVGLNIPFNNIFSVTNPSGTAKDLMIRADLSYFFWDVDIGSPFGSVNVEFTRLPIFLGARYFIPADRIKAQRLKIYGEAGVELSFDEAEAAVVDPFTGTVFKTSDSEVNFGIPIGAGIQYYVSDKVNVGFNVRWHIISDSYFTLAASIGFDL
jgi:opacity protein-like surface antigen